MAKHSNEVKARSHIPFVSSIADFFEMMRFGEPTGKDISVTRIEDQPANKQTEVPLFRNNIYRVIYLDNAEVSWDLTNDQFKASNQCIYFAQPGKLESWKADPKNKGFVVCFSQEFTSGFESQLDFTQFFPFFNPEGRSILFLDENEVMNIKAVLKDLYEEAHTVHADRWLVLKYQLFQLLIALRRIYNKREQQLSPTILNNTRIYNSFKTALDTYFQELSSGKRATQVSVSLIADQLSLTPGYLGTAIKDATGKSAIHHINQKTILEAKSYLLHTDLQVKEIAYKLGFENASYFVRFFKKFTSTTPKAYKSTFK